MQRQTKFYCNNITKLLVIGRFSIFSSRLILKKSSLRLSRKLHPGKWPTKLKPLSNSHIQILIGIFLVVSIFLNEFVKMITYGIWFSYVDPEISQGNMFAKVFFLVYLMR